jgi:hypothetical protein
MAQQQRFAATADALGFIDKKLNGMLFRASHVKTQPIEHATGTDAHRFDRQIVASHSLNECRGGRRRLYRIGNRSNSVLIRTHGLPLDLTPDTQIVFAASTSPPLREA